MPINQYPPASGPDLTRRHFLRCATTTALATTVGCAQIVPRHVIGGKNFVAPSETVTVAGIGAGGMGGVDIAEADRAGARIVALCDVDDRRGAPSFQRFPEATRYRDFRRLLDDEPNVDAVIVGTPDHTHALITLAAMERGKHVYCEKPLAHSFHEVRTVTEAARKYGVATQLGNQGHSFDAIREFCECIWAGTIGHVREVHIVEAGHTISHIDRLAEIGTRHEVPDTLDWEGWLATAPARAYNPMYLPGVWRGWSQFGSGMMGDWMCHLVDPVFWALDLGAPVSVIAHAEGWNPGQHIETFPESTYARFDFPARGDRPPVAMHWYDGLGYAPPRPPELAPGEEFIPVPTASWSRGHPFGALVVGDTGKIVYGSHGAAGWRLLDRDQAGDYEPSPATLPSSRRHHEDWLQACKGIKPAGSNFDYGGPLSELPTLGNIALRFLGQQLQWDAHRSTFTNIPEANHYLNAQYRDGWSL